MTRNAERSVWIGVVVLLLGIGTVLFSGPLGRMVTACQGMMGGSIADSAMMQDGGMMPRERGRP